MLLFCRTLISVFSLLPHLCFWHLQPQRCQLRTPEIQNSTFFNLQTKSYPAQRPLLQTPASPALSLLSPAQDSNLAALKTLCFPSFIPWKGLERFITLCDLITALGREWGVLWRLNCTVASVKGSLLIPIYQYIFLFILYNLHRYVFIQALLAVYFCTKWSPGDFHGFFIRV